MSHNVAQTPYIPKRWPRWVDLPDGNRMIVRDCKQMSAMMGEEYDENAELVVKKKAPPTMEEILAAGYAKPAADGIFATEQAKAEQGIQPYGAKLLDEFVEPAPHQTAESEPKHQESVEELLAKMAEQSTAAHVDVLKEMDPMGIFATPEPEQTEPVSGITGNILVNPGPATVAPEKKRGKAAKE